MFAATVRRVCYAEILAGVLFEGVLSLDIERKDIP
jgi:hypothetical protein